MKGKIVKGIAGFYYVYTWEAGMIECKARGIFRNQGKKPLVGDDVEVVLLDEQQHTGTIEAILPRQSQLIRPAVANVNQALVIFAAKQPDPSFNLLDRFLCMMEEQKVPTIICINKCDLAAGEEIQRFRDIYEPAGYPMLVTSAVAGEGLEELKKQLTGYTTTVAGPSGAGKSSLINALFGEQMMDTGALSEKLGRGRHTTRHSQILPLDKETYLVDTPGFSSLDLPEIAPEELRHYYREFAPYEHYCRFRGCCHISEPDCGVKEALEKGRLSHTRYDNYRLLYEELNSIRKY